MIWERRRVVWDRLMWGDISCCPSLSEIGVWRGAAGTLEMEAWARSRHGGGWGTVSMSGMALLPPIICYFESSFTALVVIVDDNPISSADRVVFPVLVTHSGLDSYHPRMMSASITLHLRRKASVLISGCLGLLPPASPLKPCLSWDRPTLDGVISAFTLWITNRIYTVLFTGQSSMVFDI